MLGIGKGGLGTESPKGVGPSMTLAWSGWKQPDIPVEVDMARLQTSQFKNGFAKCVLLYLSSKCFVVFIFRL